MNVLKGIFRKKGPSCCEVKIVEKIEKASCCKEDEKREEKK